VCVCVCVCEEAVNSGFLNCPPIAVVCN